MPHIEFDLDAKKLVPNIARALAVPDMQIGWGFVELWQWCWTKKTKLVSAAHLAGFFGVENVERLAELLVAFEFLDGTERRGEYIVRGAEKRLGVTKPPRESKSEAGRRGGKATAARGSGIRNLLQHRSTPPKQTEAHRSTSEAPSEANTEADRSKPEAHSEAPPKPLPPLHPSTSFKNTAGKSGPPVDEPAYQLLVEKLFTAFQLERGSAPAPRGKDWLALKRLRGRTKVSDAEILARWERGLRAQFKARVDTFWDLDERWDALAADGPGLRNRLTDNTTDAEFLRKTAHLKTDENGDLLL